MDMEQLWGVPLTVKTCLLERKQQPTCGSWRSRVGMKMTPISSLVRQSAKLIEQGHPQEPDLPQLDVSAILTVEQMNTG